MSRRKYLPALGFESLAPLYDPLARLTTRETVVKSRLIAQAGVEPGHRVLDVGCGTATLLLMLAAAEGAASPVGLDVDGRILGIARAKVAGAGDPAALVRAFSSPLPFRDRSFDRALSTLMLHHLTREEKESTLREIFRVLRPGGQLHVGDWGRPHSPLMRLLSLTVRFEDGHRRTVDNLEGRLPAMVESAGFEAVRETARFATIFGTLALLRAEKPAEPGRSERAQRTGPARGRAR